MTGSMRKARIYFPSHKLALCSPAPPAYTALQAVGAPLRMESFTALLHQCKKTHALGVRRRAPTHREILAHVVPLPEAKHKIPLHPAAWMYWSVGTLDVEACPRPPAPAAVNFVSKHWDDTPVFGHGLEIGYRPLPMRQSTKSSRYDFSSLICQEFHPFKVAGVQKTF